MFCPKCGAQLPDEAKFCRQCGTALGGQVVQGEVPVTVTETFVEYTNPTGAGNANQGANPSVNSYVAPEGPAATVKVNNAGVLGRAWNDITHSKGWVKNVFLLSLINLVPFYSLASWGRLVQFGVGAADVNSSEHTELNLKDLNVSSFKAGLIQDLGGILLGMILIALPWFTGMIPFIGWIILPILVVFFQIWVNLSVCRSVLKDKFAAALDLTCIYKASKKNRGKLVGAVLIPGIACGALIFLVAAFFITILAGIAFTSAGNIGLSLGHMSQSTNSSMVSLLLTNLIGVSGAFVETFGKMKIFILIFVLLAQFLFTMANCWTYRAIGHWINISAPEWADSSNDETR